jgi:hypothetical protein
MILAATRDAARLFLELGTVTIVLAVGTRLAARTGFSSIPLYLVAGIVLGALGQRRRVRSGDIPDIGRSHVDSMVIEADDTRRSRVLSAGSGDIPARWPRRGSCSQLRSRVPTPGLSIQG